MHLQQLNVEGNEFIGLLGIATDKYAILCRKFPKVKALDVPIFRTHIYDTDFIGLFCAANSNAVLMPELVSEQDTAKIKDFLKDTGADVCTLGGLHTAIGNLVVCNDNAAIVSPLIKDTKKIEDALDVEIVKSRIAGKNNVGACCVATNRGFVVHPEGRGEIEQLQDILKVDGSMGSVNFGFPFVGAGLIANSNGYVTGERSSGIELGYLDRGLGFV